MGQYHMVVNLDKREFIMPHTLGSGLKAWEHLANPGTGRALVILLTHPAQRGGGDLDIDDNWHGPERADMSDVGVMPEAYPAIAKRTIGRWRGDRIAMIGDYAEDGDLPNRKPTDPPESMIYGLCRDKDEEPPDGEYAEQIKQHGGVFTDITEDVCAVIEHELNGTFYGEGWRHFGCAGDKVTRWAGAPGKQEKEIGEIVSISAGKIKVKWPGGFESYKTNNRVEFF